MFSPLFLLHTQTNLALSFHMSHSMVHTLRKTILNCLELCTNVCHFQITFMFVTYEVLHCIQLTTLFMISFIYYFIFIFYVHYSHNVRLMLNIAQSNLKKKICCRLLNILFYLELPDLFIVYLL